MLRKIQLVFVINFVLLSLSANAQNKALVAEISKAEYQQRKPQVVDAMTRLPIEGAKVSFPMLNQSAVTDKNGNFNLKMSANSEPVILSVEKNGYRPYSLTLKNGRYKNDFLLQLEKLSPNMLVVSQNMMHLGDNAFSEDSAGACFINSPCVGPSYSKNFNVGNITPKSKAYITIGSVIGIDTVQAMKMGQNNLVSATSTPLEIFINQNKIGEVKVNGDNQRIPIPIKLLNPNSINSLMLKTGINKASTISVDYDDIELINLIVDII